MRTLLPVATLVLLAAATSPVLAQESAARGEALAKQWCAACHVVAPGQQTASADVPSFAAIAAGSKGEFDWLGAFLADPHPPMPAMSLTRQQIRDLGAYLRSLRQ